MHLSLILKHLNLLLVDDNHRTHAELYSLFAPMFKSITMAQDAETAFRHFEERPIDLIITDIRMPGVDGLSFIERIRAISREIPILILSAHTDQDSLFRAANLQIDGYITKPLNFKKLETALTRAITRLEHRVEPMRISHAITYHPLLKSLHVDDREVSLGNKECTLLELFLYNHHKVISKLDIHEAVWPDEIVSESALKNLLSELRRKLHYDVIRNRHGLGWTLATEK
ncbi:MAG TPA: response regulator transcription factor [Gammaproteobacteria bacterium]|jgi:DNA-binding response OmpR family regulator